MLALNQQTHPTEQPRKAKGRYLLLQFDIFCLSYDGFVYLTRLKSVPGLDHDSHSSGPPPPDASNLGSLALQKRGLLDVHHLGQLLQAPQQQVSLLQGLLVPGVLQVRPAVQDAPVRAKT